MLLTRISSWSWRFCLLRLCHYDFILRTATSNTEHHTLKFFFKSAIKPHCTTEQAVRTPTNSGKYVVRNLSTAQFPNCAAQFMNSHCVPVSKSF